MNDLAKLGDLLVNQFAIYKDEILLISLLLNVALLASIVATQSSKKRANIPLDKVKAATYHPKPFRKDPH